MRVLITAAVVLLTWNGSAQASAGWFEFRSEKANLIKAPDQGEVAKFILKVKVGQPFALVAEGMVQGRGASKASKFEPEGGTWIFDDEFFNFDFPIVNPEKTSYAITLKASKPGTQRIRFSGMVLGYQRRADFMVEVTEPGPAPPKVSVRGKLTYRGAPVQDAIIAFHFLEAGDGSEGTTTAATLADGSFSLGVAKAGAYGVSLSVFGKVADLQNPKTLVPLKLPPNYADNRTTPLRFTVKERDAMISIDLK